MGGEEIKNIKETTLVTFFDLCRSYDVKEGRDYKYNQINGTIKFANGSFIQLVDLKYKPTDPEFNYLGSMEFTGGFVDQAEKLHPKAYKVIRTRIRYKTHEFGVKPVTLMSCNPAQNWLYSLFFDPWRKDSLEVFRAFIPALVTDNPKIDPQYIQLLEQSDEDIKERLLYGNWDYEMNDKQLVSSLMFENAKIDDFDEESKDLEHKIGVDVARKGGDSTILVHRIGNVIYDIQELKLDINSRTDISGEIAEWIINYCVLNEVGYVDVNVDAIGVGAGVVDACRSKRFYVNEFVASGKAPEDDDSRYKYGNMRDYVYWQLRLKLQKSELKIYQNIKLNDRLKREILAHNYDTENDKVIKIQSKDEVKKKIGHSPDVSDAVTMTLVDLVNERNTVISIKTNIYG